METRRNAKVIKKTEQGLTQLTKSGEGAGSRGVREKRTRCMSCPNDLARLWQALD